MPSTHTVGRRAGATLGVTLACLLTLAALPVAPQPAARAQARNSLRDFPPPGAAYRQTNLVSSVPGLAAVESTVLKDAWGISAAAGRPICVAASGSGLALRFFSPVAGPPILGGGGISIPGGRVSGCAQSLSSFYEFPPGPMSTRFRVVEELYTTLDGRLLGYNIEVPAPPSTTATIITGFPDAAITGMAMHQPTGRLYLADFGRGEVILVTPSPPFLSVSSFGRDATLPPDYHPFNVQLLNGKIYVAYAKKEAGTLEPDRSFGAGFVNVYDLDGHFISRLISQHPLAAPYGLALAPPSFGVFGGALLVGNYGQSLGSVNAFDPDTGAFLGTLRKETGDELFIPGLRGLAFGSGGLGGDPNTLYFVAGDLFGSLAPTNETATSVIQFSPQTFQVFEEAVSTEIRVSREGDLSGPATVNYATVDGSATQKTDYDIAVGTLRFAPGESVKTFRVLVVYDSREEFPEEVNLVLSNPTGAGVALGRPNGFLSIRDGGPPVIGNSIDNAHLFVRQHYNDFLNRDADPEGFRFWADQITICPSVPCRDERRVNVSAAFFLSIEFQETGFLNIMTHHAAFGRRPLYGEFMAGTQALQRGVVFATPGAAEQLEANKRAFFDDFVSRLPFAVRYPTSLEPATFVDGLYRNAGVVPTPEERAAAIDEFQGSGTSDLGARARVLRRVAENRTLAQQQFNAAFVLMQYFGYLRRNPDEAGFNFWLAKLNDAGGDFRRAEMVRAFIESIEYRGRFGPT